MNEGSSSGGRGPSSIKPPTIKPPTLHDQEFGTTTLGVAPEPASYRSAPTAQSQPAYAAAPSPPPGKQNILPWVVIGVVLLLGVLVVVLAALALILLR
jgi:hypothetical protein